MDNDIKELQRRAGITEDMKFEDQILQLIWDKKMDKETLAHYIAQHAGQDAAKASLLTMQVFNRMGSFPGMASRFFHGQG